MRLGFAIAVHVDADILLLDEVFAVGDEAFQRKCIDKILEFKQRGGTVCFVSHSAAAVERLCERAILLTKGQVEYDGSTSEALKRYHQALALEEPEEAAPELREWGSGEVRVAWVAVGGRERGRPGAVRVRRAGGDRAPPRRRAGGAAAGPVARAAGLGRVAARREQPRSRRARLGRRPGRAGASLRDRPSAARRGRVPGERRADGRVRIEALPPDRRGDALRGRAVRRRARRPAPRGRVVAGRRGNRRSRLDELPDVPRLARADGDRARSPVQALHGRRGAAAGGCARPARGLPAGGGGDLRRPRQERLLRSAHGPAGGRGAPRHALVRGARVGDERVRAVRPSPSR